VAFSWIAGETRYNVETARPLEQIEAMFDVVDSLDADPAGE